MKVEEAVKVIESVAPDDPVTTAFLVILENLREEECDTALVGGLSSEDRAYNCGRAAAITDAKEYFTGIITK